MRPALMMAVMVLSVLAVSVPESSCQAARRERLDKRGQQLPEPAAEAAVIAVKGVGQTLDEAEADALQRACDEIGKMLTGSSAETAWKPSPAFLRQTKAAHLSGDPENVDIPGDGPNVRVPMVVELTPDLLSQLQKMVRLEGMAERQRLAARGLAGLLAILLVVFGYLKLEDVTKGYHSTLLRLMALAVLVTTAVGLWKLG